MKITQIFIGPFIIVTLFGIIAFSSCNEGAKELIVTTPPEITKIKIELSDKNKIGLDLLTIGNMSDKERKELKADLESGEPADDIGGEYNLFSGTVEAYQCCPATSCSLDCRLLSLIVDEGCDTGNGNCRDISMLFGTPLDANMDFIDKSKNTALLFELPKNTNLSKVAVMDVNGKSVLGHYVNTTEDLYTFVPYNGSPLSKAGKLRIQLHSNLLPQLNASARISR